MIPAAPTPLQQGEPQRWQALWRDAVRDPRQLLAMLGLDALADGLSAAAARQFPLRVPRGFIARMRPGDAHDPLLRQVLPVLDEEPRGARLHAWTRSATALPAAAMASSRSTTAAPC